MVNYGDPYRCTGGNDLLSPWRANVMIYGREIAGGTSEEEYLHAGHRSQQRGPWVNHQRAYHIL